MGLYSNAIFRYRRRPTREVKVGEVGIGGNHPIRVQSMTITDTKNTTGVVQETRGLVEAGCEIVRITAPTVHHAENLKEIRAALRKEGIKVPLVADIHFTPQAAMIAADYVEKVRINPGNYADRKLFAVKEYTDAEYEAELERMAEKFLPLVRKCKTNGVAMRIGTNHGSLSDRIMNRYGDTPLGMVESALEFVRLCESEGYRDIVLSMKASSPFIMIAAYRLLAERMNHLGMDYPFHLGVTEAGEGEDGRVKSAIGIGSLLEDGIGDTVRVSLTEDSIHEIPVAQRLVKKFNEIGAESLKEGKGGLLEPERTIKISWNPMQRERRHSMDLRGPGWDLGGSSPYGVFATYDLRKDPAGEELEKFLSNTEAEGAGELLYFRGGSEEDWKRLKKKIAAKFPQLKFGVYLSSPGEGQKALENFDAVVFLVQADSSAGSLLKLAQAAEARHKILDLRYPSARAALEAMETFRLLPPVLVSIEGSGPIYAYRRLAVGLAQAKVFLPIHLYIEGNDFTNPILEGASAVGSLLVDGIGDSVEIGGLPLSESLQLSFNILQASRLRISKAEFIACPSCGRTLFDLQETTQRIKAKTAHLKGVKIAIMGCIVNGPGEMADADFGYVGGGPGKIHLYVGKECVEKNIPAEIADERLIDLIKSHDRWLDPPARSKA